MTRAAFPDVSIRRVAAADRDAWLRMRYALWPAERGEYGHERDVDAFFAGRSQSLDAVLVADASGLGAIGFLELRVRNYAEGSPATRCRTSKAGQSRRSTAGGESARG